MDVQYNASSSSSPLGFSIQKLAMCHQKPDELLVVLLTVALLTGSALVFPVRAFQHGPGDNVLDAATFTTTVAAGILFQGLEPL